MFLPGLPPRLDQHRQCLEPRARKVKGASHDLMIMMDVVGNVFVRCSLFPGKVINDSLTIKVGFLKLMKQYSVCHNHFTELLSWTMDPLLTCRKFEGRRCFSVQVLYPTKDG